ncbi:MAG TPA: DUF2161 family putative PD-(D/E)XK-type phosphodiesterase [Rhodopila sp.]|jgi:hypothetical protein|nr:DUF2161 family putative PD-(D/E)XK-type phosphodiesterase [Rhodopila sp.]
MTNEAERAIIPGLRESDLYGPVKGVLEALGYTVRGEVGRCDVLGVSDAAMVAVELKLTFGLPVLYQALQRLPSVDLVYVAVAVPGGRRARGNWDAQLADATRLCRMLGVGLMSVRDGEAMVHADPTPYQPRKRPTLRARLLSEFVRRSGDHNLGGTNKRPRVTAYREDALACARVLAQTGAMKGAAVGKAAGVPKASTILRDDVYGWFAKIARGLYEIGPAGRTALDVYADVVAARGHGAGGQAPV